MTETQPTPPHRRNRASYPEVAVVRGRRMRLSLAWLVPIAALVVGAVLIVRTLMQAGPEITITFRSAEGLEAGRTEVRFKEVVVGKVTKVALSPDRERVLRHGEAGQERREPGRRRHPLLGRASARRTGRRQRAGHAVLGLLHRRRRRCRGGAAAALHRAGGAAASCCAANPGAASCSPRRTSVRSTWARRSTTGAREWAGWSATRSTPTRDALAVQVLIEPPNERLVTTRIPVLECQRDRPVAQRERVDARHRIGRVDPGRRRGVRQPGRCRLGAAGGQTGSASSSSPAARPRWRRPTARRCASAWSSSRRSAGSSRVRRSTCSGVEIGTVRSVALLHTPKSGDFPVEVVADIYPLRLGSVRRQFVVPRGASEKRRRAVPEARRRQRAAGAGAYRQPADRPALRCAGLHAEGAQGDAGRPRRHGADDARPCAAR